MLKLYVMRSIVRYRAIYLFFLIIFLYQQCLKVASFSSQEKDSYTKNKNFYLDESTSNQYQRKATPTPPTVPTVLPDQKVIKYNLMEEIYGTEWNIRPKNYFSSSECNIDYANANRLQQDHPCVIDLIKRKFLHKPSHRRLPYKLSNPTIIDPSDGQSQAILRLLRNQTNGFFIECGALDGEFLSNTLYMERSLNWRGVLIEADQKAFSQLITRNRKAYTLPVCLSTKPYPLEVNFNASDWSGSFIVEESPPKPNDFPEEKKNDDLNNKNFNTESIYKVQCFPLYSILLAVGQTDIDFFGLDVEGSEFKILKTIPWQKVDIKDNSKTTILVSAVITSSAVLPIMLEETESLGAKSVLTKGRTYIMYPIYYYITTAPFIDFRIMSVEWNHIPEGEAAMTQFMEQNKFVKFGHIEMAFSREVVYVKDFLSDFRQFEFD